LYNSRKPRRRRLRTRVGPFLTDTPK
jgi:hypothetical protein